MAYLISVFNLKTITKIDPQTILDAITASNYHTLCDQYSLDPEMIEPTLAHLKVIAEPYIASGYFALEYRGQNQSPIVVYLLDPGQLEESDIDRVREAAPHNLREKLNDVRQVVQIELSEDQLADLGLLLGYELARWAAELGKGFVRGLDGEWYRLNRHKAFLPVTE